jgi:hypothetical protein
MRLPQAKPCVLAVVLVVAAALRLPGYLLAEPLWLDEAWRAVLALDPDVVSKYLHSPSVFTAATAPLYVVLLKAFALLGVSELSLRATSFIAGLLAVILGWLVVARRAQGSLLLPLFAALLVAGNFSFVRYSNELKPYMFEVLVHLALAYFWVRFVYAAGNERRASFIALVAAVIVSMLCGANSVFLIPALGLSALYAWSRDPRSPAPGGVLAGFVAVVVVMGIMYFGVWAYGRDRGLIQFWSQGFNPGANESYAAFVAAKLNEIATDGAFKLVHYDYRRSSDLIPILWTVLAGATLVGIAASVARRNFALGLFYATFVLTAVALNFLSFWPLGAFPQNQFLYIHLIIGAVLFLNEVPWPLLKNAVAAAGTAIILIGWVKIDQPHLAMHTSPPIQQSPSALAHVAQRIVCASPREQVFINPGIGAALEFYTRYHDKSRESLAPLRSQCSQVVGVPEAYSNAEQARQSIRRALRDDASPWFAYAHLYGSEIEDLRRAAESFGRITDEVRFTGAGAFRLRLAEEVLRQTR